MTRYFASLLCLIVATVGLVVHGQVLIPPESLPPIALADIVWASDNATDDWKDRADYICDPGDDGCDQNWRDMMDECATYTPSGCHVTMSAGTFLGSGPSDPNDCGNYNGSDADGSPGDGAGGTAGIALTTGACGAFMWNANNLWLEGQGATATAIEIDAVGCDDGAGNSGCTGLQFVGTSNSNWSYFEKFRIRAVGCSFGVTCADGGGGTTGHGLDFASPHSDFTDSNPATSFSVLDNFIEDVFVAGFPENGINMADSAWGTRITDTVVEWCDGHGIHVLGGADFQLTNSKIVANDGADLWLADSADRGLCSGGADNGVACENDSPDCTSDPNDPGTCEGDDRVFCIGGTEPGSACDFDSECAGNGTCGFEKGVMPQNFKIVSNHFGSNRKTDFVSTAASFPAVHMGGRMHTFIANSISSGDEMSYLMEFDSAHVDALGNLFTAAVGECPGSNDLIDFDVGSNGNNVDDNLWEIATPDTCNPVENATIGGNSVGHRACFYYPNVLVDGNDIPTVVTVPMGAPVFMARANSRLIYGYCTCEGNCTDAGKINTVTPSGTITGNNALTCRANGEDSPTRFVGTGDVNYLANRTSLSFEWWDPNGLPTIVDGDDLNWCVHFVEGAVD